jgi:Domain of unknown function (DUF4326)
MTRSERERRIAITRQITRREQKSTERYPVDEIAQALESELEHQERAYRNKRARLPPAQRAEWQRKIAELRRFVQLLRRDPRLPAMDLRMAVSPQAFEAIERMPPVGAVTVKLVSRAKARSLLRALRGPGENPVQGQAETPKVISLHRRKPRVVPEGAVYIGHRWNFGGWDLPESKWANPFTLPRGRKAAPEERAEVIAQYERWLLAQADLMAALPGLRGKDLACWCAPKPCHGDVLLRLANS